ncbi:MAG TPA: PilZ domain-containing protein [Deferrisomatales bacterium]|nr:PilZ domain-containing protein [Deferrisomatales bacterium]
MVRSPRALQTSGEAKPGTPDPLLCPPCRRDVEAEVWTLRADVRRAVLAVSRGGDTGLVLCHFDDALHGLARLAGYQQQGVLDRPPDFDALRGRLVGQRYSVVSRAIAGRTSPAPPETLPGGQSVVHAPVITEVLGQLAALQVTPRGGGAASVPELQPAPDLAPSHRGSAEQRGEPRTRVRFPIRVSPGERGGTVVDFSPGGIGCESGRFLAAGTPVWVTFCRRCRLEVEGIVRWSSAPGTGAESSVAIAGVQFRKRLPAAVVGAFVAVGCAA